MISRDIKIKFLNSVLIFLCLIIKKNWIKCSIKATKINVLKNKNPIYKIIDNVKNCFELGKDIAGKIKKLKINSIRFDRNGILYHGKIKSLADGARDAGLEF